jgi:hypothetical protein
MKDIWPWGIGGWIAAAIAILLLIVLVIVKSALTLPLLAWFVFALSIAILLR